LGYNSFHAGINPWASLLLLGTLWTWGGGLFIPSL
jgi:hypothetical protein